MPQGKLEALENAIQDRYKKLTNHLKTGAVVSDFRPHQVCGGLEVSLRKYGRVLSDEELSLPYADLADALAHEAYGFERGVSLDQDHPRCFLEGYELPSLLESGDQVKLRHIFGVAV